MMSRNIETFLNRTTGVSVIVRNHSFHPSVEF